MTKTKNPSESETEILQILWERQPSTMRAIHDILSRRKDVGFTTTLKLTQRLFDKGLVTREAGVERSYLYSAAVSEAEMKQRLLNRFLETAFRNSTGDLVLHALGNAKPTKQELAEIKKMIVEIEKK